MRRAALLCVLVLVAVARDTRASGLDLRLGAFAPRAQETLFSDVQELYTVTKDDLRGFTWGVEYNLVVAAAALALAFTGPGQFSLEAAEGMVLSGLAPGIAALLGGLVLAGGALLSRKVPATAPVPSK